MALNNLTSYLQCSLNTVLRCWLLDRVTEYLDLLGNFLDLLSGTCGHMVYIIFYQLQQMTTSNHHITLEC